MKHKFLIIGGGAAGIMAAITAKDLGADVAILESNDRIGKKILTTGNGRCNITNEFLDAGNMDKRYFSSNPGFPLEVLKAFNVQETIHFFEMLGLPLITLEGGKMYPLSLQASSVLDIFRLALEDRGIPVYYKHKVKSIIPSMEEQGFTVLCQTESGEVPLACERLLLCSGGLTAPSTGSDGSGYVIAKGLGHRIIPPLPALVQLKLNNRNLKALSGIKFEGLAQVCVNGECARSEKGEILFTDYGISGPPILQLSRLASYHLFRKNVVTITVDMMPQRSPEELEDFLENHWGAFGHRSVVDSLIGIINKKMIPILLKEVGVDNIHKNAWDLQWKEKKSIYKLIKNWEFTVTDTNSFVNAQVTAGGVDTTQVDEHTLESKLIPGLYLAGEVLDVDGDCGGYNLQWAWSSGYAAGKAAAQAL